MVGTLAPWIPYLRDLLPSYRRVVQLDRYWLEGRRLTFEELTDDQEFDDWKRRCLDWQSRTVEWLERDISAVEAQRFAAPVVIAYSAKSFSEEHNDLRNLIQHQLPELIRLRDEQARALR